MAPKACNDSNGWVVYGEDGLPRLLSHSRQETRHVHHRPSRTVWAWCPVRFVNSSSSENTAWATFGVPYSGTLQTTTTIRIISFFRSRRPRSSA